MTSTLDLRDALLIGCGELGSAIGLRLAHAGRRVFGVRRNVEEIPVPIHGIAADLTQAPPELPEMDLEVCVVALTARPRSEAAYRSVYVDGMNRAIDALDRAGQRPRRAILVSSTGVFGDVDEGTVADEDTAPCPADGPARMLLEAEHVFNDRLDNGTVLRLSGLYGGASTRLIDQVRRGEISDPHRWTNRLHRDDAVGAVMHVLGLREPASLYVATDDEPVMVGTVAQYLAEQLDAPTPPEADRALAHGKRLSNARLRASGWAPQFPTFREGYRIA